MSEPLGLTPDQRAWSDASEVVDMETPSWWTPSYRDAVIAMRVSEELRKRQGPGARPASESPVRTAAS